MKSSINKRIKEKTKIGKEVKQTESFLKEKLSSLDFVIIQRKVKENVGKETEKFVQRQHKKLTNLTKNNFTPYLPSDFCPQDSFSFVKEINHVTLKDKFLVYNRAKRV